MNLREEVIDYGGVSYVCLISLLKLYSYPRCFITLFLAFYLLLVLLVIVRIVDIRGGPLRSGVR